MSDPGGLRGPVGAAIVVLVLAAALAGGAVSFPGFVARRVAPSLVFFPADLPADRSAPVDHGLPGGEERWIRTADGVDLHAWWIPSRDTESCGTVLFFHGNAGHLADRAFLARRIAETGFGVLLVDYRGFGRSGGSPDEEGLRRDARAAYRHLVRQEGVRPDRLVLAGHSLGAAVTARLAVERPAAAAILTGAFTSVPELGARLYRWLPGAVFRGWPTQRFETRRRAAELDLPVFVARGDRDRVVPRSHTRAVYEALPGPAVWHEASGAGHGDLWGHEGFWRALAPFLEDVGGCG